jgi:hypothetical protein
LWNSKKFENKSSVLFAAKLANRAFYIKEHVSVHISGQVLTPGSALGLAEPVVIK